MNTKGLPIEEVFKEVRKDLGRKTGGQQVPWELSSLEGQFYFSPGKSVKSDTADKDEFDDENKKLEAEQSRLEKEKAAFAKQKALDEKRQRIAEEKERLTAEKEEARQNVAIITQPNNTPQPREIAEYADVTGTFWFLKESSGDEAKYEFLPGGVARNWWSGKRRGNDRWELHGDTITITGIEDDCIREGKIRGDRIEGRGKNKSGDWKWTWTMMRE